MTLMVITLHLLAYGGLQERVIPFSGSYQALWLLAVIADCAVNCFVLISGFVSYESQFRYTKVLRMHLTVLFHGIVITGLIYLINPETVDPFNVLQTFLPIIANTYWYYTVYVIVFFLSPLLNRVMRGISKPRANGIILAALVLFSVFPTVLGQDYFAVNRGYSPTWLATLYFIGAYFKKYHRELRCKKRVLAMIYAICIGITWAFKIALELWSVVTAGTMMDATMLIDYCSPTIFFASAALVLLFSFLEIPPRIYRLLSWFLPVTFGVYIIHEHPLVRKHLIRENVAFAQEYAAPVQLLVIVSTAILIFLVCSCMERFRSFLFRHFRIDCLISRLEQRRHSPLPDDR